MSAQAVERLYQPRRYPVASGVALGYLSLIVLIPLAAVVAKGAEGGWRHFWQVAWNPEARAALELTFELAGGVVAINAVTGTALAWTLVRDEFPGKRFVNALIDLPFALPTIVAGLTLLALYGPTGIAGVNIAFTIRFPGNSSRTRVHANAVPVTALTRTTPPASSNVSSSAARASGFHATCQK